MTTRELPMSITAWHAGSTAVQPPKPNREPSTEQRVLPLAVGAQVATGRLEVPERGIAVCEIVSPRPLRLWLAGVPVLNEALDWRSYQREIRATVLFPCAQGTLDIRCEVGERPTHLPSVDQYSLARNRAHVMAEVLRLRPDALIFSGRVLPGDVPDSFPISLRFLPTRFLQDGRQWQHILVRPLTAQEVVSLSVGGQAGQEGTGVPDRQRGQRRWYVPLGSWQDDLRPLRASGPETRVEPAVEIAGWGTLSVAFASTSVEIALPLYEALGRAAPRRVYRRLPWPSYEQARTLLPEPVFPAQFAYLAPLYEAAWEMLLRLVRDPEPASGLPHSYVSNGPNFPDHLFVWDTSFTTMCLAYGLRALPATASLDVLYSRQFDGGYIHREHNVHDGLPALFEPGFSPNPPLMSMTEWQLAALTGSRERLAQVYPMLCGYHRWIAANRRLPAGTYWTTGLASGLDNSPAQGEGYPCLTAQMAHDAEVLAQIARLLGREEEARAWEQEHRLTGEALNQWLWDEQVGIYATSLPGGGYSPHKVVTAFWPLWAGVVPPERVAALLAHLQDPHSFWRHHPLPSLAADSPCFQPAGEYWQGSTWAPTSYAAIKGLQRVGRGDLASALTALHLQRMFEVWSQTGKLWENYSSERSTPGNNAAPDYCWSALGPIALLFEVLLGLEPDATRRTLRWLPAEDERVGVKRFPLGPATISLLQQPRPDGRRIEVMTDAPFSLELAHQGTVQQIVCPPGFTELLLVPGRTDAIVELCIKRDEQTPATDALTERPGRKRSGLE
jgi:hypothetical protein